MGTMNEDRFRFKACECPTDAWEVTIVGHDENFDDRNTVYYHCCECSEDFAILDFDTEEILYLNPIVPAKRREK